MLTVRGLCKQFQEKRVLHELSLTVNQGEIVFLTGPSGSGKSTALRAIANLDAPDAGNVCLNGLSANSSGFAAWRRDVMYVPQNRISLNSFPRDLFVRTLKFSSRASVHPLSQSEVESRVEKYVQICLSVGLERENIVHQKWSELSGGQAQRACVALCLALRPKVLLLDEPSSSCDHQSALLVEQAIINSGIAALWVSHDVGQPSRVGGRIMPIKDAV